VFSSRGALAVAGVALIALGLGWRKLFPPKPKPTGPLRVAVLPFANLSGDGGLDWLTDAGSLAVAVELETQPGLQPFAAHTAGDGVAAGAARLVHVTFRPAGQGLELTYQIEPVRESTWGAARRLTAPDPIDALRMLAPALRDSLGLPASALKPLPSASAEAWKSFASGRFEDAVSKDPAFGLAWRAWAERALASGDRIAAAAIVTRALAADPRLSDTDRLRLRVIRADATGDRGELADAAAEMAAARPADPAAQSQAAAAAIAARRFDRGIALYLAVLKRDPDNQDAWNSLGYAQAYAGNLPGAMEALKNYERLAPNAANPLDSMGEVQMRFGRFDDAAKLFLAAAQKTPGFLDGFEPAKAAYARLFAGDTAGAGQLFDQYMKGKEGGRAEAERAVWLRITGRTQEARALLERMGPAGRPLALLWQLEEGALAGEPKGLPEGYLLVSKKKFAEAEVWWSKAWSQSAQGMEASAREILGWCLVENGKLKEAARLLEPWPTPQSNAEALTPFFYVPRTLCIRAAMAEQANPAEAGRLYALYLKLTEGQADGFGLRAKAHAFVARTASRK
jgi:tetratricopeptide (TPR) repeat protein